MTEATVLSASEHLFLCCCNHPVEGGRGGFLNPRLRVPRQSYFGGAAADDATGTAPHVFAGLGSHMADPIGSVADLLRACSLEHVEITPTVTLEALMGKLDTSRPVLLSSLKEAGVAKVRRHSNLFHGTVAWRRPLNRSAPLLDAAWRAASDRQCDGEGVA